MATTSPTHSQVIAFPESEVSILDAYLRGLPSEATRKVYRRCVLAFDAFVGDRHLHTATRRDVEAFRSHMEDLGQAPSTVGRMLSALNGYFSFALAESEVTMNPVTSARRPKLADCSSRKGITKAETQALLNACDTETMIGLRDRALILVLAIQGWRISEALGLQVEDLGDEQGHRVAEIIGKGNKVARVPLAASVWTAITTWLQAAKITEGPIFVAVAKGGSVKAGKAVSAQCAWKRVRYLAGRADLTREIHPHLFRHGCATAALAAGVPLHQVQDHLRHADPRTTRRYDSHRMSLANPTPHVLAAGLEGGAEE
jgi:integrase/recombinase XerD